MTPFEAIASKQKQQAGFTSPSSIKKPHSIPFIFNKAPSLHAKLNISI
jgi:hypothetical protein